MLVGDTATGFQLPALGSGRSHRGGGLRRAPASAAAPALPAGRGHRLVLGPGPERPRGARVARGGPLSRHPHPQDRRPGRGFPPPGVRGGRPALPARRAPRSHLEIPRARPRERPSWTGWAAPPGVSVKESVRAALARDGGGAAEALRGALARRAARLRPRHAVAARVRGGLPLRGDGGPAAGHRRGQGGHGARAPHGPARRGRRRLWQDGGGAARGLQGGVGGPPGGRARAHHRARPAALEYLHRPLRARSRPRWSCSHASGRPGSRRRWWPVSSPGRWTW